MLSSVDHSEYPKSPASQSLPPCSAALALLQQALLWHGWHKGLCSSCVWLRPASYWTGLALGLTLWATQVSALPTLEGQIHHKYTLSSISLRAELFACYSNLICISRFLSLCFLFHPPGMPFHPQVSSKSYTFLKLQPKCLLCQGPSHRALTILLLQLSGALIILFVEKEEEPDWRTVHLLQLCDPKVCGLDCVSQAPWASVSSFVNMVGLNHIASKEPSIKTQWW